MCEVGKDQAICQGCDTDFYLDELNEAGYCQACQELSEFPEGDDTIYCYEPEEPEDEEEVDHD